MQVLIRTANFGGSFFFLHKEKSELPVLALNIYTSPSIYIFSCVRKEIHKEKIIAPLREI